MKAEAGGPGKATAGLRIDSPAVDQTSRAFQKYCKMSSPVHYNYNHVQTHVRFVSSYYSGYGIVICICSTCTVTTTLTMFIYEQSSKFKYFEERREQWL